MDNMVQCDRIILICRYYSGHFEVPVVLGVVRFAAEVDLVVGVAPLVRIVAAAAAVAVALVAAIVQQSYGFSMVHVSIVSRMFV